MGMYTELFVEGTLRADTPQEVVDVVTYLFGTREVERPTKLPDHEFFSTDRWEMIGSCSSFYHVPMALSGVHTPHTGQLCFVSRSDIKDYDNEIAKLIAWLTPYCELLRGWSLYEEDSVPTMFSYENYP